MSVGRLTTLFRQLPLHDAVRLSGAELSRWVLDRHRSSAYSQTGEDMIIDYLLSSRPLGRYVDVGCNHPVAYSNTYRLYLRGWSGLALDGNPAFGPLFAARRPRDTFVNACVSDSEKDTTFHVFEDNLLSSLSPDRSNGAAKTISVRTRTLDSLLAETGFPAQFDLLSIDAEHHDLAVLRSITLDRYRPSLIVVEAYDLDMANVYAHPLYKHATQHDYALAAVHAGSLFLLDARAGTPR